MSDADGSEQTGDPIETIAKPDALLALHDVTAEMFSMLRRWFGVAPEVTLDLREVDSAVAELGDPMLIAALAMRKLQALHLLATPGVRTTTDVVVAIVNDLERALIQAPVDAAQGAGGRHRLGPRAARSRGRHGVWRFRRAGGERRRRPRCRAVPGTARPSPRSDVRGDRGFRRGDPLPRLMPREIAGQTCVMETTSPVGVLDSSASSDVIAEALRRDGAVIVDRLVEPALMDPSTASWRRTSRPRRSVRRTSPAGARVAPEASSPVRHSFRDLAVHPTVLTTLDHVLGDHTTAYQLHLTQVIDLAPGQGGQPVHRDQWAFDFFPFPAGFEVECHTMWAMTDFTEANGGTRVIPGSNHWDDKLRPSIDETVPAEMAKGSVLLYVGSVYHGGGANGSEAHRLGINVGYTLGWLRQEENQYLACPVEIARTLPPELARPDGVPARRRTPSATSATCRIRCRHSIPPSRRSPRSEQLGRSVGPGDGHGVGGRRPAEPAHRRARCSGTRPGACAAGGQRGEGPVEAASTGSVCMWCSLPCGASPRSCDRQASTWITVRPTRSPPGWLRIGASSRQRRVTATEPLSWDSDDLFRRLGVDLVRSNQFLCHRDDFAAWFDGHGGKRVRMEDFYRWQRQRLGYLMDGDEPAGGRWNFDHDNREPPPGDRARWPEPVRSALDDVDRAVLAVLPPTARSARIPVAGGRPVGGQQWPGCAMWSMTCSRGSARTRTPCSPAIGTSHTAC